MLMLMRDLFPFTPSFRDSPVVIIRISSTFLVFQGIPSVLHTCGISVGDLMCPVDGLPLKVTCQVQRGEPWCWVHTHPLIKQFPGAN